MAKRYTSRRSARRLVKRSQRNFIVTLFLIAIILYATVKWVLPYFVNSVGFVKNFFNSEEKPAEKVTENAQLAPPILNIPFEATPTAEIDIKGYATPNSKVKLFLDDESKQTVDVSENGDFMFLNVSLNLGINNIYAKSLDEKNQESLPSKTMRIIFDDEKPTLNLNEPEDNEQVLGSADKTIQGGDKKVKFSGNTEIDAQVFINGNQLIVDKDGNFSTELPLNEGENMFDIKAKDSATNEVEISRRVIYQP